MDESQEYKEKSKTHFNKQASNFDSSYAGHLGQKIHEIVVKKISSVEFSSLLDIGCGTGNFLFDVQKIKKISVAGIDISEKMLEQASKRLGESANLKHGDSEHLPWESNSFDIVTCFFSFHHYPNPNAVLKEMRRVLNSGGKVIIADPWAPPPFRQIINFFNPFYKTGEVRIYSKSEMRNLVESADMAIISWKRVGTSAFLLFATTT
jgi:ubiquinone/menaquinone biosynthesis C-methylase UbiE